MSNTDSFHETVMDYCLQLAQKAVSDVKTNPMVGACLVHNQRVIGAGYHIGFGKAHAEVMAIQSVTESDRDYIPDSTLYVTLEPCNHHGKTPPCTDLILQHGIKSVYVGTLDPNPLVAGKGIERLRSNGIDVTVGFKEEACLALIKPFVTGILDARPYIILKVAKSSDGFIGQPGKKIWLSEPATSRWVHKWRAESDAILAGYRTLITDNPRLNTRFNLGTDPIKVVYDREHTLPSSLSIFDRLSAPCLYFSHAHRADLDESNVKQMLLKSNEQDKTAVWDEIMKTLYKAQIGTIIIEGGSHIHQQFIDAGLWDEIRIIETPHTLKSGILAFQIPSEAHLVKTQTIIKDKILYYERIK